MALTLLGLTVLVFLMLRLIPGTVVEQMIGADAIVSPEMVAQLRRFFGLDQPWWVQYSRWLGNLAQGDLGTSWRTGKPVVRLILERLPVTIELTLLAVGFALALGIAAGIVSAVRRDRAADNVVRVGALLGLSVPVFWQGTMLILFFSLYLRWMPSAASSSGPSTSATTRSRSPPSSSSPSSSWRSTWRWTCCTGISIRGSATGTEAGTRRLRLSMAEGRLEALRVQRFAQM